MAKAAAPAVSVPQPDPGSEVENQLAQIEAQPAEGEQAGDSFTAFAQAAKQELDPQYQAFKAASAKQLEQLADPLSPAEKPGEPELSWWDPKRFLPGLLLPGTYEAMRFAQSQAAISAYQQSEIAAGKMVQGVLGEAGNVLNPAAKYSDQNNAQLSDGISKAQAEIDNLAKEQAGAVDEFSVENAGMRIAQLHGDITAMQKQLASRTPGGQAEPPTMLEQAGSRFLEGAAGIQHDYDVLMGRKPPEAPQDWLHRIITQEPGVPENPVFEASPAGAISRTTGQVGAFMALSELGTVPELLGFAGAQYQGDVDAALAAHKDLATANRAGQMASLFAPVQMAGFKAVLGPFLSGDAGKTIAEVRNNMFKNAAIGAGVGASQQLWENATAILSGMDPDRKWNQGLGDSVAQQAATMTVLGLATETPSFALRSLSQARIDAYKPPGAPAGAFPAPAPEPAIAAPIEAPRPTETEAEMRQRLVQEATAQLGAAAPTAPETEPAPASGLKMIVRDAQGNIIGEAEARKGRSEARVTVGEMLHAGGDSARSAQEALDAGWNRDDPMPKPGEKPPLARAEAAPTEDALKAWKDSLSPGERSAVEGWAQGDFAAIRKVQRAERDPNYQPPISQEEMEAARNFESAIAKAPPYVGTAYRAIRGLTDEDIAAYRAGGTVPNSADSSETLDLQRAKDWAGIFPNISQVGEPGDQRLVIEVHGTHKSLDPTGPEKEVILPRDTTYKVRSFQEGKYGPYAHHVILDQAETPGEPQAPAATEPLARREVRPAPVPGEPEPFGKAQIRDELSDLRDRVGPRADFLLADERSLPMRYRSALVEQGLNANNFKAFFDRDTGDLVVNPNNITSRAELNDIVNRNFIPNTFRDKANIVPLDSWHQASDNPTVAGLLAENPNADSTVDAIYDPQSGTVFTNLGKLNASADPIGQGLQTAVHEIAVHQGLRSMFSQGWAPMELFLQRVWNGFQQTGTADQVATAAGGRNLDDLARSYNLGTEQPDGTLTLKGGEQRRLAEELLARYSERFDPAQLDKVPTVLQRAIGLVKDGLARFQGLHFTDDQAFRFIRDSWRGTEAPRSPEVNTSLLARRIIKAYEPIELERARANDAATRELTDAIGAIAGGAGRESPAAGATQLGPGELASSSDRVGAYAASTGRGIDYGRLSQRSALRVPGERDAEHELHVPSGARDTVLKVTRPNGRWGPYGPSLERVPAQEQGIAAGDARSVAGGAYRLGSGTAEHYLDRLALSNELFGTGNHLEGFTQLPGSDTWSIASSQPRVANFRPSTPLEIADYMASKGFHPVDERTYFDPERQVAILDAHGGNVLTDQTNGRVVPVDVVPTRVDNEAAAHMQRIIEDPARLEAMKDHLDLDSLQKQLGAKGIDLEAPRPPAAQMRMEEHFARDEAELSDLRAKNAREGLSPEERQRMDDIEFGPLMKRDLELELGPESDPNEPAHRLLQRALETILTADPSYGVRVPALRTVLNERDFMTAREFNASISQLLYEKGGRTFWDRVTGDVYDQMGGDTEKIMNAVMANAYPREINAQLYKHLWNDLAELRQDAITRGDAAKQAAVEGARNSLDSWANEARTQWGKEGAAWQDVYFSAQGILGKIRSDYDKVVRKQMQKHPEFAAAVEHLKFIRDGLTKSAAADPGVQRIFEAAQRQHNSRLPAEYAKAIAEDLAKHFEGMSQEPADKPMLAQVFDRFKATIAAKIKENANIPMPDVKKLSASQRVVDALSNWKWFEDAWNQTINELKNAPDAKPLFFQKVKDALDVPFSGSELSKVVREQGIDMGELFKQHRSRIGATIDSLSDFLSKRSNLSPEQSSIVQRAVEGHIQSQIREKIQAEFQKILDKAPKKAAGPESMRRLTNLINMGAFEEKDVANALAPVYGYAGFSPEMSAKITQLNNQLEKYRSDGRNGFQTEAVRQEILRTIAEYARTMPQLKRYWVGILTGNLMSGVPTHIGAFASEFLQGMTNLATKLPWTRPAEVVPSFIEAMKALGKGMGQAITDHSQYLWATGKDPALFRTEESLQDENARIYGPGVFETAPTQRALAKVGLGPAAALGKIVDVPYRQLFRTVSLLHNLIYSGFGRSTEMLAALRVARDRGMSPEEGRDWANDMIYADQGRREAYRQQAAQEGLTGYQARMRVQELIDQGEEGESLEQTESRQKILDQADRWGTRANFMQDPEGILGLASHALAQIGEKAPFFKQFFPFVRIPTNLINETINMTPLGVARYLGAEQYFSRFGQIKLAPGELEDLKANLLGRMLIGTTGMTALALLATQKDQDGNPLIEFHGAGPSKLQDKYQLMDRGWMANSIKIGNRYIPFEFVPMFGALQAIGNYYDAYRYEDMPSPLQAVFYSLSRTGPSLMERGSLKGVSDLLDLLTNSKQTPEEMATAADRQLTQLKNFVPLAGSNLAKQFYQTLLDNRLYENQGFAGMARDVPFAASAVGLKPRLNFLGEPIRMDPMSRIWGKVESPDPVWRFLDQSGVTLTKPSAKAAINGQRIKEDGDKFYNYTGFRGTELHRLLTLSLPSLNRMNEEITDPEARAKAIDKAVKQLETRADLYAKGQIIQGNVYEVPR